MKQRFSSLDVKVIAHELSASLVSLRVSNIYDLSSKILLFKFAKPDNKQQLLIDSGFRCHLTDFARTTAAAPSTFVQKLRKVLKTRRLTAVSQIGTDRIIEFKFSDGQFRLYLEFFASGNVILTDNELKIITLLRNVPEGEGQEPQRPGLLYSLENRQNYGGVPELTKDRVNAALATIVDKASAAAASGKKVKKKPGDELRKGLATTITELPPILVDHAMKITGFDSTSQPTAVLENEELLDHLLRTLEAARKIVDDVTVSATCNGYIFAKRRNAANKEEGDTPEEDSDKRSGLLYEDFHPFIPQQFQEDPAYTVLTFDNYNKMVDEFFSSIEGQKLESKLTEREAAAKRKLEAAKADQAKRIEGLQETQNLNARKASAIETNIERVQEAMDAVNGLIAQGMDWVDIGKLIDRERKRNNPVAAIIASPLKLSENTITLLLGEAEDDDNEDAAYETDSDDSDDDDELVTGSKPANADTRLKIDIDLSLSPFANARQYYEERKVAASKQQKTIQQTEVALKNAEQKIAVELKKGLKQEKPLLQPVRRQMWFEKFIWFISTDGYLVLGGKDASQNEMLYRRYLKKGDTYVHADLHGAPTVIIKNNPQTPDAPIPPSTLSQAGSLSVCSSAAWDSKAGMSAWWVNADQVSKSAPTGEFLPTGSFMVRGKKNFLPPAQLLLGFGLLFKISEESKAKHVKHRLNFDSERSREPPVDDSANTARAVDPRDDDSDDKTEEMDNSGDDTDAEDAQEKEDSSRGNPLQTSGQDDQELQTIDDRTIEEVNALSVSDKAGTDIPARVDAEDEDAEAEQAEESNIDAGSTSPPSAAMSGKSTPQPQGQKKEQPKRGQRGKAKKIAAKYRDQDDEDRVAIEALIGATAGRKKAEAEAAAKAEREAANAAAKERRRAQHQRQQREMAEHEEVRKLMLEEGIETLDPDETEKTTSLDSLVGAPMIGDEILEVLTVCAPYAALGKLKYKVKLQPGAQKKGKAVKEVLEAWKAASTKKGVVDENSQDKERMWPREVELIKGLKAEEAINCVPVSRLRVMMSGGSGGGGGGGEKGKAKGNGGGGKGKKR
ncbi:fibronectin-binding protein A N-terminus-domain-containing protein [Xylariales sp. PMI_506]|nr:fibronectin-binding protein A N-terminus-domain-containing protein [Xylariales sp. PMI_506]